MKDVHSHKNDPKREHIHDLDTTDIRNPETLHEESDINTGSVYKSIFWLAVCVAICYGIVYWMMKANDARMDRENAIVSHVPKSKMEELPPKPRLQLAPGEVTHPLYEGLEYRDSVVDQIESYGYINKATGTVHIPIELAKQIMLQKGFPVRAGATSDDGTIWVPSSSSAGRVYMRRDDRIPGETYTITGGNLAVQDTTGLAKQE